jgi:hypothetical protein
MIDPETGLPHGFPRGLRVLVVDDDSLCLKVVEQMLKRCDYAGMYVCGAFQRSLKEKEDPGYCASHLLKGN